MSEEDSPPPRPSLKMEATGSVTADVAAGGLGHGRVEGHTDLWLCVSSAEFWPRGLQPQCLQQEREREPPGLKRSSV